MQWRTAHDKGERKRAYMVCGSETHLREEVVDTLRADTPAPATERVTVYGTDPTAVWLALNAFPSDPDAARLVLVRDAEALSWSRVVDWLATRALPGTRAVFVLDVPTLDAPEDEALATVVKKAKYVRCAPLNEEHAIAWIRWHAPVLTTNQAAQVISRSGDLLTARDVARKLYLLAGARPSLPDAVVTTLATPRAHGEFAAALLAQDKRLALDLAPQVPEEEYPGLIALLDANVEVARRLREVQQVERGQRAVADLARTTGLPMVQVRAVSGVSRMYTDARAMQATTALAAMDHAVRSGATDGVLEALVAAW